MVVLNSNSMLFSSSHRLSADSIAFSSDSEDWQSSVRLLLSIFKYHDDMSTKVHRWIPFSMTLVCYFFLPKFFTQVNFCNGQDLKFHPLAFVEY